MTKGIHPAVKLLNSSTITTKEIWSIFSEVILNHQDPSKRDWPSHCLLPSSLWRVHASIIWTILANQTKYKLEVPDKITLEQCTETDYALGKWRLSQGIYQVDEDLSKSLLETELPDKIPSDVLLKLPEWAIYVELPNIDICGTKLIGFWAHLDWTEEDGGTDRLSMIILTSEHSFQPISIPLDGQSIAEHASNYCKNAVSIDYYNSIFKIAISYLLYICSQDPEITNEQKPNSAPSKTYCKASKNGLRIIPAPRPKFWKVGTEIGNKIRAQRHQTHTTSTKRSPHLRRAHWHGYWTGPRSDPNFAYKWLHPIFVNPQDDDENLDNQPQVN